MVLADISSINFIPTTGPLDSIFHQTWLSINILGVPGGSGYKVTLIGLLILLIIAFAVNGIAERLTTKKIGGLFSAVIVTVIGSWIISQYARLPFDFLIEGVAIVTALLGALIIGVFYTLIRSAMKGGK